MCSVMQASQLGKQIEVRIIPTPFARRDGTTDAPVWVYVEYPDWNWKKYEYRIKPEPLECYLILPWPVELESVRPMMFRSRESAEMYIDKMDGTGEHGFRITQLQTSNGLTMRKRTNSNVPAKGRLRDMADRLW